MSESQILLSRGDIIPPDEMANTIVEVKGRKIFGFHQLIQDGGSKELDKWIEQVEVDWNAGDKKGFYCVVFKPNTLGFYICYDSRFHNEKIVRDDGTGLALTLRRNSAFYMCGYRHYVVSELSKEWLETNKEWFQRKCSR